MIEEEEEEEEAEGGRGRRGKEARRWTLFVNDDQTYSKTPQ